MVHGLELVEENVGFGSFRAFVVVAPGRKDTWFICITFLLGRLQVADDVLQNLPEKVAPELA